MKGGFAKLGFIHRWLWARDGTYRVAVVLGPPSLLGCAAAAALWCGVPALERTPASEGQPIPWARPITPEPLPHTDQPRVETPTLGPPKVSASGKPAGFVTGWLGSIHPIEVSPTLDVNVLPKSVARFTLDQPSIDMGQIVAAGPPASLYVGVEDAALMITREGSYALTIRIERSLDQAASCLGRFSFAGRRLVSTLNLNFQGPSERDSRPVTLNLRPGLYRVAVAFGCWRDQHVTAPGHLIVLIRHPGEQALQPARPDEILRPLPEAP